METGMKMRFGGDEMCGDSRFSDFLGSKNEFIFRINIIVHLLFVLGYKKFTLGA